MGTHGLNMALTCFVQIAKYMNNRGELWNPKQIKKAILSIKSIESDHTSIYEVKGLRKSCQRTLKK